MKTSFLLIASFFFSINLAQAQDSWQFKSPQDSFQVVSANGRLFVGDQPVNKKVFDGFLKVLLKANRGECPTLNSAMLTVEAKSGATTIVKKFYPVEGAIEANGKCAELDYDTGWSLPFHREWLIDEGRGKITIGNSMSFKSKDLNFQLFKKEKEWSSSGSGFLPDLVRMGDFARTAEDFEIEKKYSKKIKDTATHSFTLSTGGLNYRFYQIAGLWAIEFPKGNSLLATKDFSMIGKFTATELGDKRSEEMVILTDKKANVSDRIANLEKLANVDSPVFKNTLHNILKESDENALLKERVALLLVDRPSVDNIGVLITLIEKGTTSDQILASKALRRMNPNGPVFTEQDQFHGGEKVRKWKEWYAKYRQAQK